VPRSHKIMGIKHTVHIFYEYNKQQNTTSFQT
jgi:hypothetical protein